jgi:hypothetical protein
LLTPLDLTQFIAHFLLAVDGRAFLGAKPLFADSLVGENLCDPMILGFVRAD